MDPRARRELAVAVGLCLAGAALVLLGAGQVWAEAVVEPGAPFPPSRESVAGSEAAPGVPALGLVGLAGVAALLATRRLARLAVGAVLLLAGGGLVALAAGYATDESAAAAAVVAQTPGLPEAAVRAADATSWPWVAALGGLLLVLAGALTLARGRSWAAMSRRYDAPGAVVPDGRTRPRDPDAAAWDALDRGEDPTT